MRVLTIIDSLAVGGAEKSLSMLSPHLVDRGVDMHVAFLTDRPGLNDELSSGGATLHSLAGREGWMPALVRTVRLIREVRPDLVHTTLFSSDIIGRTAGWVTRTPVVSSFVTESYGPEHVFNPEYRAWKVRAAQVVDAVTARFVTRFHAVSEASATVMSQRLRVPTHKIQVITRGRDPIRLGERTPQRRQQVRTQLGISEGAPLVFAAARHYHLKGLDVLITAFAKVRASFPDAELLIAGRDGPATRELHQLIKSNELGQAVTMSGYRPDVPDLMAAADVFVLPSRAEGSPGVLIEAMAMEAPTVASDMQSVRELVGRDGEIAYLATVGSADEIALAIIRLLQNPEHARTMASAGRQRFLDRYAMDAIADATTAMYQACISGR